MSHLVDQFNYPDVKSITESKDISIDSDQNIDNKVTLPDPFAYITTNDFTSEKFKIEVRGLPKFYGLREFKKLLNKLDLNCNKVKDPSHKGSWLYACFRSEEDRDKAILTLNGFKWKGCDLTAKISEPIPDPFIKRKLEESNNEQPKKKIKIETKEQQEIAIKNSSSPLYNLPYEEQIMKKTEDAKSLLRRLGEEIGKTNPALKNWIEEQKSLNDGLPCKVLNTRYCDNNTYYRNKCEFTIGKNDLTGERCIGFRLGTYASGSSGVAPIDSVITVPKLMVEALKNFEKFVRSSELEVFSPVDLRGYWKQLTVRLGMKKKELMIIIGFNPQNMTEMEICSIKEKIIHFYKTVPNILSNVKSLYFQRMKRKEKGSGFPEYELLLGDEFIEETLCDLNFKISPGSFFQINIGCAEVLIESVRELSKLTKDTVVVDVCCGTGTIGLCLAKDCSKVLGIELLEEAVKVARENALKNNINNCEFFCGKADEILRSVTSRISEDKKVLAVLDPPRAGLHQKSILMLRRTKNLDRIVFLSCDGKAAFKNFTELCRGPSKTLHGSPFVPISAVVVDLFPHTNHYELVIYFERFSLQMIQ